MDDIEATLRAVPLQTWTGEVKTTADDPEEAEWVGPVTLEYPDYPALAAAVQGLVEDQDKALRYSARERIVLGEKCIALRAEVEWLRGALLNYWTGCKDCGAWLTRNDPLFPGCSTCQPLRAALAPPTQAGREKGAP